MPTLPDPFHPQRLPTPPNAQGLRLWLFPKNNPPEKPPMLPANQLHTYMPPDPLPPEAIELFGHDVQRAWDTAADPTSPNHICIGVTTDGQWLGGIWMLLESIEQSNTTTHTPPTPVASIKLLIVSPQARGQGLAGRLLRKAINLAADHHCTAIRSTAGFGCGDHLMMYERLGFARTGARQLPYLVSKSLV